MRKFVFYTARGYLYDHDKNTGKPTKVVRTIRDSGVVENTKELYGCVFRQCKQLLPCDRVEISTFPVL